MLYLRRLSESDNRINLIYKNVQYLCDGNIITIVRYRKYFNSENPDTFFRDSIEFSNMLSRRNG